MQLYFRGECVEVPCSQGELAGAAYPNTVVALKLLMTFLYFIHICYFHMIYLQLCIILPFLTVTETYSYV
jgi:hypothetical protein